MTTLAAGTRLLPHHPQPDPCLPRAVPLSPPTPPDVCVPLLTHALVVVFTVELNKLINGSLQNTGGQVATVDGNSYTRAEFKTILYPFITEWPPYLTAHSNIQILRILPTQCACAFNIMTTINSYYFPKQH